MGDNWKTMALRFSKLGYQLHLIDQRNHGRSFHSEVFNYQVMASDLKDYCDYYQLENFVLLGHSMGGKTAMFFSLIYPNRAQKLIIGDISPRFYPVHHKLILEGLSSLDFSIIKTRKPADVQLSKYIIEHDVRQFLLKNLYWVSPGNLGIRLNLKALKASVKSIGEALPLHFNVTIPTLFLKAERSLYIEMDDEKQILNQFLNSNIQTISDAGHWLHAENPDAFYREVSMFLS